MPPIETTKVQDRGIITLPRRVREKLGVKKGATVAFVETEDGRIEVRNAEAALDAAFDEIGRLLKEKGITLEELMRESRKVRKQLYEERYGKKSSTDAQAIP